MHEAHGTGACGFALQVAGQMSGPILWVQCEQGYDRQDVLNPQGLATFFDPSRLVLARCPTLIMAMAIAEEGLRSGALPLVILDLPARPDLTAGRRLNLAAETGQTTGLMVLPVAPHGNMTAWTVRHVDAATRTETMIRARAPFSHQALQAKALSAPQLAHAIQYMKAARPNGQKRV